MIKSLLKPLPYLLIGFGSIALLGGILTSTETEERKKPTQISIGELESKPKDEAPYWVKASEIEPLWTKSLTIFEEGIETKKDEGFLLPIVSRRVAENWDEGNVRGETLYVLHFSWYQFETHFPELARIASVENPVDEEYSGELPELDDIKFLTSSNLHLSKIEKEALDKLTDSQDFNSAVIVKFKSAPYQPTPEDSTAGIIFSIVMIGCGGLWIFLRKKAQRQLAHGMIKPLMDAAPSEEIMIRLARGESPSEVESFLRKELTSQSFRPHLIDTIAPIIIKQFRSQLQTPEGQNIQAALQAG